MKTKEQELDVLGLLEMNSSEKSEVDGGSMSPYIVCCIDIPPMEFMAAF